MQEVTCVNVFKNKNMEDRKEVFNQLLAALISHDYKECTNQNFTHFKSS